MEKIFIIPIQSFSDIITNSSSELFIIQDVDEVEIPIYRWTHNVKLNRFTFKDLKWYVRDCDVLLELFGEFFNEDEKQKTIKEMKEYEYDTLYLVLEKYEKEINEKLEQNKYYYTTVDDHDEMNDHIMDYMESISLYSSGRHTV
jgi:hypothetical protein